MIERRDPLDLIRTRRETLDAVPCPMTAGAMGPATIGGIVRDPETGGKSEEREAGLETAVIETEIGIVTGGTETGMGGTEFVTGVPAAKDTQTDEVLV